MQTFLPYPDFTRSAQVLDNKRLGKQRVECLQILQTLAKGPTICSCCKQSWDGESLHYCFRPNLVKTPWYNHPAVKMWRGYDDRLVEYGLTICLEWVRRGFKDNCFDKIDAMLIKAPVSSIGKTPDWINNLEFHASHRSNLLRKDPMHYGQFGWTEPPTLEYVWPVR